jgi:type IV secretion system protein VirB10
MIDPASGIAAPRPKTTLPPLDARAPRPAVARLRKGVAVAAVMSGAGLVAAALAWSFVVKPELRARAQVQRAAAATSDPAGAVRPSETVTGGPATYAQIEGLPPPRGLAGRGATARSEPGAADAPIAPKGRARAAESPARDAAAQARASQLFFRISDAPPDPPPSAASAPGMTIAPDPPNALVTPSSPYELQAGSLIPAVLLSGIDTARPGPVVAAVTENVYDTVTGAWLLAPQGSRLVGRYAGESRHGDRRAFIAWERLLLPNGKSVALDREVGVDATGTVGVRGRVQRRLGSLALATLFGGAITTLGQAARDHDNASGGLLGDAGDAAAIEGAQVGGRLIGRELDVRPSIRLDPGARVRVLVTHDLVLEAYAP